MVDNVSGPLSLLALIFAQLALLGLIHARLDHLRHPLSAELGPVLGIEGYRKSFVHGLRWSRLILWGHWRVRDPVCSLLCLLSTSLACLMLAYPLWRSAVEACFAELVGGAP